MENIVTSFDIYLFTRLDNVNGFFAITIFLSFIVLIVLGLAVWDCGCYEEDKKKSLVKYLKLNISVLFICIFGAVFVPSTKEAAAMYVVPKLYNSLSENKKIAEIPDNLINLANSWIKDLTKEKKDK